MNRILSRPSPRGGGCESALPAPIKVGNEGSLKKEKGKNMSPKKKVISCLTAIFLGIGATSSSNAGVQVFDLSAGSNWRTTTDPMLGNQWAIGNFNSTDGVSARSPYSNADTQLNANRTMWNCGVDGSECLNSEGVVSGGSGPTEAFFGLSFFAKPGAKITNARIAIIADDFFDLVINGQEVIAAVLADHLTPDGQPEPLIIDLEPFLHSGNNTLAIRAMDGFLKGDGTCESSLSGTGPFVEVSSNLGSFCKGDLFNEYLFISGSATVIPEPGALHLMLLGFAGLIYQRRRAKMWL